MNTPRTIVLFCCLSIPAFAESPSTEQDPIPSVSSDIQISAGASSYSYPGYEDQTTHDSSEAFDVYSLQLTTHVPFTQNFTVGFSLGINQTEKKEIDKPFYTSDPYVNTLYSHLFLSDLSLSHTQIGLGFKPTLYSANHMLYLAATLFYTYNIDTYSYDTDYSQDNYAFVSGHGFTLGGEIGAHVNSWCSLNIGYMQNKANMSYSPSFKKVGPHQSDEKNKYKLKNQTFQLGLRLHF